MDRIERQRKKLRILLEMIIDNYKLINNEMEDERHTRGSYMRSLKPKSGEHVFHMSDGIDCVYTHTDGKTYTINIHPR